MAEDAAAAAAGGGGCEVPIRLDANTAMEKENPNGGMNQKECMERIAKALKHPTVKFLREHMEKAGCPFWVRLILATDCKTQGVAGRYTSRHGISVCCNNLTYQDEVNQVLIHELVHAYDDCRAKNMDWKNCAHHACSEIRANHLSGDCHYKRELLRGFMKIRGHEQARSYISPQKKRNREESLGFCMFHYTTTWLHGADTKRRKETGRRA